MPFFKKKSDKGSDKGKRKLNHQLYLARENPEPIFDISECEITDIPEGVFSLCRVLQKEELLAFDNCLTTLSGGGKFHDLAAIKVLDLHNNEFVKLPDELCYCVNLQKLIVSKNKLKQLPDTLGQLKYLRHLDCHNNKLTHLPCSITELTCLEYLDVSSNLIHRLPQELCHVRTLRQIKLDAQQMQYPSESVCNGGTAEIMQFLCTECEISYICPSEASTRESSPMHHSVSAPTKLSSSESSNSINSALTQYEADRERKRQERVTLEKQIAKEHLLHSELARRASINKQHILETINKEHEKLEEDLKQLHLQKDKERQERVEMLTLAEKAAAEILVEVIEYNEKNRKTEELLEKMERERLERERWFEVRQEELLNIRRSDIFVNMEHMVMENDFLKEKIEDYLCNRDNAIARRHFEDDLVQSFLSRKQETKKALIDELLKEDVVQKEAFEALMQEKDTQHQRISSQITLIESELAQLSHLEVMQRDSRAEMNMNVLCDRRLALTELLCQLLQEKDKRELQLRDRLVEMEDKRLTDQTDFWLVQYQRLLDRKPSAMIDVESQLEKSVVTILEDAKASEYKPVFARHRITIETLSQMTDADLAQLGVRETGLRKNILDGAQKYVVMMEDERAQMKEKKLLEEDEWLVKPPPPMRLPSQTGPAPPPGAPPMEGAERQDSDVSAHWSWECVICLDEQSGVLFLNCGHICCCRSCSEPLTECPLCRGTIVHKIKVHGA